MYNHLSRFSKQYCFAIFVILAIPALYAYNPLPLFFLNDDFIHVPLSQQATWGQRNSIRPFNDFSLYLDYKVWGNNAAGYHLTNLLLHLIDSIMVYFLSVQVFRRFRFRGNEIFWSACAALLFWGYAFHSEGVLWIIARTSCLSTFFFLVCSIIFIKNKISYLYYILSFISYFLGLLTYESIIILPIVLVIIVLFSKEFQKRGNYICILGYLFLTIFYIMLRVKWTGELAGKYEGKNFNIINLNILISNFSRLIARTLVAPQIKGDIFIISLLAFCIISYILWSFYLRKTISIWKIGFILVLMTVTFLPYLSLGIDTHGVESERYLYLPSTLYCIFFTLFCASTLNKKIGLWIFIFYFFYNQFYLIKSSKAFVISSEIAKSTIEILKENKNANTFIFINLPQESYGIPIFRLGLHEGISWRTGIDTIKNRIVVSSINRDELFCFNKNLVVKYFDKSNNSNFNEININTIKSISLEYTDSNIIVCRF